MVKYGVFEMQGRREYQEDRYIVETTLNNGNSLFGVFDGHGSFHVSEFLKLNFVHIFVLYLI